MIIYSQVEILCKQYNINNWNYNIDGSIDVDGNVDMSSKNLSSLPLKFARVMGNFCIQDNNLTTLKGAPISVGGNFNCYYNQLINFEGSPKWVGGDFFAYSNALISLVGSPKEVVGDYYISGNNKLSNLLGCTPKIHGNISFDDVLSSTYCDDDVEFEGSFFFNETYSNESNKMVKKLPVEIIENRHHLKLILKYQRYFGIWNDDQTLNKEYFNDLIAEIDEGLK
ncbi:hypothetical protein [Flavobacterium sp. CAN_S2]|uniref:hypothetical protein n=1 Tax=Flavobacterium sp. CAN_S2 TaxID=2787726 RepID=UPI0018CB6CE8